MRNLALHSLTTTSFENCTGDLHRVALNLDDGTIYAVVEHITGDADVQWQIWKLNADQKGSPEICATFTGAFAESPTVFKAGQLASVHYAPDQGTLVIGTRAGDIVSYVAGEDDAQAEVVGSVEEGILAASWSPDDSILVLVTGHQKLMLMTPTFEVLTEGPLNTSDFGSDAPINVGWGSKQTQFHGSLGKTAAQAPSTPQLVGASPDDDGLPRISWRTDGALFVVSSLEASPNGTHRTLRIYDRLGALQSTSESVPGLEHTLAWRHGGPGSLIVGTQRFGFPGGGAGKASRHDVVFVERNGLRHGEFGVRMPMGAVPNGDGEGRRKWGYRVREVVCSAGTDVVALWMEAEEGDIVQLWTTGNYHWYLKQEIAASSGDEQDNRFTSVMWHPEEPLTLLLTSSKRLVTRVYAFETWSSSSEMPNDSGAVTVIDGDNVLLTPFRTQNIPPPMSSCKLRLSPPEGSYVSTPVYATFAQHRDCLVVLYENGAYRIWELHTRLGPGSGPVMKPEVVQDGVISIADMCSRSWRQIVFLVATASVPQPKLVLAALGSDQDGKDRVYLTDGDGLCQVESNGRLILDSPMGSVLWQSPSGEVLDALKSADASVTPSASFPEFCAEARATTVGDTDTLLYIGLASSGKLFACTSNGSYTLASNTTSYTIASSFIVYTTSTHEAHFAPLHSVLSLCTGDSGSAAKQPEWEKRRIERGARIVCAVPSALALVLQMPRGNLETIAPRPLVMAVVKQAIAAGEWQKAFDACRKHRIDLSVLVEEEPSKFMGAIPDFVKQVDNVDYFGLFLTNISRSSLPQEVINDVCDHIREELERVDLKRFMNAVLTAYVVKNPSEREAALRLLLKLRDESPDSVEEALKYLVFLVDANDLFDIALGMYDFGLVLLVAQHAQKDPREYLPFLRHLRDLPDLPAQRFAIDDHLRRYASALGHLREAGDTRFEEAMLYASRHRLLPDALRLWRGSEREKDVIAAYAEDLFERREFKQAALAFVRAERQAQALAAYERALEWRSLFALAVSMKTPEDEIKEVGYRVAEELGNKKRHVEAGHVLLEHCSDLRHAVMAFVEGGAFAEARRVIALHDTPAMVGTMTGEDEDENLMASIFLPGLFDAAAQIKEDLSDMRGQMEKQRARIRELRERKIAEPDAFYGEDNPALAGVDVMTDISQPGTTFTRYTVAPTSVSRTSTKKSSKQRRKAERNTGKKGTAEEEEYLLRSVTKLTLRFATSIGEVDNLIAQLLQFTPKHRATALDLLKDAESLRHSLEEAVDEMWTRPETQSSESADFQLRLSQAMGRVEAVDKVTKPDAPSKSDWRTEVVEALQ